MRYSLFFPLLILLSYFIMAVELPTCGEIYRIDTDNDGVIDRQDNCKNVPNSTQRNSDTDSFGDACDNCPTVSNEDQSDIDDDKLGDLCDPCPENKNNESCATVQTISIMAANLSSGNYSSYEDAGIRIFQGLKPDIVLIQEFKYKNGTLRDMVNKAFGPQYYYYVEPGNENIPNGVISRYPITSAGEWPDNQVPDRDFVWAFIDIPGEIDLQVVSIHLKGDSGSSDIRNIEAQAIKSYIEVNFDKNQYIIVGGDLNVSNTSEPALNTFRTFLAVDSYIPTDQKGNINTNEPRTKPYDWLMPNSLLNSCHTTLQIEDDSFVKGLVFDSWVYPPPLPYPILYEDSHVAGMQHMPVMKAYQIVAY